MAKFRKPFFKKSHAAWYVQLDGKQVRLHEEEGPAFERYHELMAARKKAARFVTPGLPAAYSLGRLYAEFLQSAFKDRSEKTRGFYREKLDPLVAHLGDDFPAEELKPLHVERWVALHPAWKKGTVRTVWQAVQRLMRWGEKSGRTRHSLVCDYQKPGATRRTVVIAPEQYREVILPNIPGQHFKDLVTVAWEVGARPQEFLKAEARHYDPAGKRIVFPPEEAKVDKWPRVVYLTDRADAVVGQLVAEHPTGPLFRNASGRAWTNSSVNCEWVRLRHRLGFARMKAEGFEPGEADLAAKLRTLKARRTDGREKSPQELREEARLKCRQAMAAKLAPKFCLYHFRHSWLDRMLKAGTDALTCAILMGHRDPSMVAKTYQHLAQSGDYLRAALNKAAG
ncbi:MAG: tyrosine-type recombinase/integrase [Gemmataceae bacterium]